MSFDVHQLDMFVLIGSLVTLLAIMAVRVSTKAGLPSLLIYLLMGVLLGESVLGIRFDADAGPQLASRGRDLDAALGSLASIVAVAQIDGSWSRLKACRGVHCGWAFYDHSRNQSGHWCSMSICGSRSKARDYRRRQRR